MKKLNYNTLFILISLCILGCTSHQYQAQKKNPYSAIISGFVIYKEKIKLPPDAVVTVQLLHIKNDEEQTVLNTQTIANKKLSTPIYFRIPIELDSLDYEHVYGLKATITSNNKIIFSSNGYEVITQKKIKEPYIILTHPPME